MRWCAVLTALITTWLLLFKTEENTPGVETSVTNAYQGAGTILTLFLLYFITSQTLTLAQTQTPTETLTLTLALTLALATVTTP